MERIYFAKGKVFFSMKRSSMRLLSLLLVLCLIFTALPVSVGAAAVGRTTAYVNLRTGAGTNNRIIETVPLGAQLTVTDTSNAGWYRVTAPSGNSGYMCSDYIQITGGTAAESGSGSAAGARYTARTTAYVNLRRGAGTNYASILVVPYGASITVLEKTSASWYRVQYGSYTGYMFAQYIQITGTIAAQTPTPKPSGTAAPTAKPTATPTATPAPSSIGTAKTTAALNIRKGSSTSYASLGVLPNGTTVTLLEKCTNGWYKVRTAAGLTGYCSGDYLKVTLTGTATAKPTSTAAPTPAPASIGTARTTAALNIRKGPSTSYASQGVLANGTALTVLEKCSNGWYKVRTAAGLTGYCSGDYLRVTLNTASTPTPSATPTATPKPSSVSSISEAEAYSRLIALQSKYPTGKYWNHVGTGISYSNNNMDSVITTQPCNHARDGRANCNTYIGITNYMWAGHNQISGIQCFGFASMLSDAVFGKDAPISMHTSYDRLKVGDNIRLTTYGHSMIVLSKTSSYITVAECNADFSSCVLSWGRKITRQNLESYNHIYMTRYADSQSDGTAMVGETTTAVNIRSGPGTNYSILTTAAYGTRISIINRQNKDWYLVQTLSGTRGYMSAEYIKKVFSA